MQKNRFQYYLSPFFQHHFHFASKAPIFLGLKKMTCFVCLVGFNPVSSHFDFDRRKQLKPKKKTKCAQFDPEMTRFEVFLKRKVKEIARFESDFFPPNDC